MTSREYEKLINGLVNMVKGELEIDPFSADLFIFCNRPRNLQLLINLLREMLLSYNIVAMDETRLQVSNELSKSN